MPATLHIDTGREMRGGQWQALYLLRGLAKAGHRTMLAARDGSPLLEQARDEKIDARALRLRELIRMAGSFDLVHAHDARAHTLACFLKTPVVVSRRVAFPVQRSPFSRWKYGRPRRYIAISQFVERMLVEAGVPESRIDVVHDGVPLSPAARLDGSSTAVALDSSDPGKGAALVREAAARAGIDVRFSKRLQSDLAGAALFVYITESEGLGSAALLAMAAGVPVLASAVGGLPEIVEDGVTGMLTENSSEQIAAKMLTLIRDPSLLARLGRNGRARVEREFTAQHMVRNTLRVYEKVLA